MNNVRREKLLAKAEMKEAVAKIRRMVDEVLPADDFGEQENLTLMLLDEAARCVLEARLMKIAAGFDDELLPSASDADSRRE